MIPIGLNDFISTKGTSGSTRGSQMIQRALNSSFHINVISKDLQTNNRFTRALEMILWDLFGCVRGYKTRRDKLIIHTSNTGASRKRLKSILVLHDTMVLDFPGMFDYLYGLYVWKLCDYSVRHASIIVAPSSHSQKRILHYWPNADVRVISWPIEEIMISTDFIPYSSREERILIVASLDKHKRLNLGIDLVRDLRNAGFDGLKLTIVGRSGNAEDQVRDYIRINDPDGKWISLEEDVPFEQLQNLFKSSKLLLVPSIDEGFCLPAIESISSGTPVVHSDRGSLPEVAPLSHDEESIAETDFDLLLSRVTKLLSASENWRETLELQLSNMEKFSFERFQQLWVDTAMELLSDQRINRVK